MMLPYQVTMIPVYIIWRDLGLTGTYLPLIIPTSSARRTSIPAASVQHDRAERAL